MDFGDESSSESLAASKLLMTMSTYDYVNVLSSNAMESGDWRLESGNETSFNLLSKILWENHTVFSVK